MDVSKLLRPRLNRCLVRRLDKEKATKGGILLPERAQKKQPFGVIVAVGPGKVDGNPMTDLKAGVKVYFNDYGVGAIPDHDDLCLVANEDILGVLED